MDFNGDYALAKEMGLPGDPRQDVTFYHANLYNQEFVKANAAPLEGGIVLAEITAIEHQPAAARRCRSTSTTRQAHGLKVTEMTMQGWIAARQFVDALKATGPNFTWANLVSAWNQQKAYTAGGWIAPIDWTRQHHDPADGVQYRSQFECANFVRIHDGSVRPGLRRRRHEALGLLRRPQPDTWQEPVNLSFAGKSYSSFAEAKNAQG